MPTLIHDRVVDALQELKLNPRRTGVKKLRGRDGYRIRVGDYRVLYTINDELQEVEVYSIGHRKEVYR